MHTHHKTYLAYIAALFLLACSGGIETPKKPQISVSNVKVKSLTAQGGLLDVALQINNPNGFGIPAERIGYALSINGLQVVNGASTDKVDLPANKTKTIQLPIRFKFDNVIQAGRMILQQKKLNFSLSGDVKLPFISVPFSKSGKLF